MNNLLNSRQIPVKWMHKRQKWTHVKVIFASHCIDSCRHYIVDNAGTVHMYR